MSGMLDFQALTVGGWDRFVAKVCVRTCSKQRTAPYAPRYPDRPESGMSPSFLAALHFHMTCSLEMRLSKFAGVIAEYRLGRNGSLLAP